MLIPAVQLHAEDHLWRWRVVRSQSYKSCSVSSSYRVLSKWYPVIKQSYQDPTRTAVRHDVSSAFRLGSRWMEYQGAKDWDGLLDPLDDKLRGEILRYGYLVEAAYRSFDFDPSSPTYGSTLRFLEQEELLAESGFPAGTGYRITRSLRATSSIQMPRWAAMAPSWAVIQSSWIGYVAVCQDEKEIARLGRRDVVIAFRGTATCLEWLENLRATLTDLPYNTESDDADDCRPMVESGFLSLYTSSATQCPSLQDMLRREVFRILENYKGEQLSFTVTGHSLGAALATLAAYDIKKAFKQAPLVTVISFGGPRVGNRSFRCQLEKQGVKVLRIVNPDDVITKVPGFLIDNNHDDDQDSSGALQQQDASAGYWGSWGSWLRRPMMADKQMAYCEVGCELRLMSPVRDQSPMNNLNVAKCHDLKTYLHLVESFVGSNCPLRKTARRLLKKERPTIKLTL
ncbi:Dolichyl-diphosphooligosaccharide-protein glycosyltransferase subunit dad1 [Dionaea muscipula]